MSKLSQYSREFRHFLRKERLHLLPERRQVTAINQVQFQKGWSMMQFMARIGTEAKYLRESESAESGRVQLRRVGE